MDRRDFFKTILSTSILTPVLLASKSKKSSGELYLITDSPQRHLPMLFKELKDLGFISGNRFAFHSAHPETEELIRVLAPCGWTQALNSAPADVSFSFNPLLHPVPCSFAFINKGRVEDIRIRALSSLWKEINRKESPSSCLTIASFNKNLSRVQRGTFASVYINGNKIDKILLEKNVVKTFLTRKGKITAAVESGKVRVLESVCDQKTCVSSGPVSLTGERIICAPNQFFLEIEGRHFLDTVIG